MNSKYLIVALFTFLCNPTFAAEVSQPANPVDVIKTMETNSGIHKTFRRNHAKGFCALGEFTATPEAQKLSRSKLFSGKAIPVIARFSAAGGVPDISDANKIPRGMALRFELEKNLYHNMSMLNVPIFPVQTPEGFHELLKAGSPEKMRAFKDAHPEAKGFFDYLEKNNPPASVATASFQSLHAFEFKNSKDKSQFVRWSFVPDAGIKLLTDAELAKAGANYLETEFRDRLKKAPATWTMFVTLAENGDSTTDATKTWPQARKVVQAGSLKLTKYENQKGGSCDNINFDPNQVSDGVITSNDPVLKFRSAAYAVSYGKRLSETNSEGTKK